MPIPSVTAKSAGFSGHETFPFRYGWLPRGVQAVIKDPAIFSKDEALISLGVGKNMVRAIRHWCLAANLIKEVPKARGTYEPTELGWFLFAETGADPYMEDTATIWIVHSHIVRNLERCTTWYIAFNELIPPYFTKDQIAQTVVEFLRKHDLSEPSVKSLLRDIDCFVRSYVMSGGNAKSIEDALDCPLVELRLMAESESGFWRFNRGDKPSLPDVAFVYMLVSFWQDAKADASLPFERLLHAPLSPGRVFQLSENALLSRLERVDEMTQGTFRLDTTIGMRQVLKLGPRMDPFDVLKKHFL